MSGPNCTLAREEGTASDSRDVESPSRRFSVPAPPRREPWGVDSMRVAAIESSMTRLIADGRRGAEPKIR